jgi:hypothetical protein
MKSEPVGKTSRREFVQKLAYIAPAIVTLGVAPSVAKAGSLHCTPPGPSAVPPCPQPHS